MDMCGSILGRQSNVDIKDRNEMVVEVLLESELPNPRYEMNNCDSTIGFLDNTSLSATPKPPPETSTTTKEHLRNDDIFHRKQSVSDLLDSLFYPNVSDCPKSKKNVISKDSIELNTGCAPQALYFDNLGDTRENMSTLTVGTEENSSLGILLLDNVPDLTESTFHLPLQVSQKNTEKNESKHIKELNVIKQIEVCQKSSNADSCSTHTAISQHHNDKKLLDQSKVWENVHAEFQEPSNFVNEGNNFSSCAVVTDVELDQEDLQDLNSDFAYTDIKQDIKQASQNYLPSDSGFFVIGHKQVSDFEKSQKQLLPKDISTKYNSGHDVAIESGNVKRLGISQVDPGNKKDIPVSDAVSCVSKTHTSEQTLIPDCNALLSKLLQPVNQMSYIDKTMTPSKGCPFIDTSSFQLDDAYGNTDIRDDANKGQNIMEEKVERLSNNEISARSSSFGSSVKSFTRSTSETSEQARDKNSFSHYRNVNSNNQPANSIENYFFDPAQTEHIFKGKMHENINTELFDTMSIGNISLGIPETDVEQNNSKNVNAWINAIQMYEDSKGEYFENVPSVFAATTDDKYCTNLAFHTNLLDEGGPELVGNGENWKKLGLSDNEEFFSKEAGLEMLNKNEEEFEHEHLLETGVNDSKTSQSSTWSSYPLHPQEISRPSWWSEIDDSKGDKSHMHISIGQLIRARTETLGVLNDDDDRERPYFGTSVMTPPRAIKIQVDQTSETDTTCDREKATTTAKEDVHGINTEYVDPSNTTTLSMQRIHNNNSSIMSLSTISHLLAEISTDSPSHLASKFLKLPKRSIQAYNNQGKTTDLKLLKLGKVHETESSKNKDGDPILNCACFTNDRKEQPLFSQQITSDKCEMIFHQGIKSSLNKIFKDEIADNSNKEVLPSTKREHLLPGKNKSHFSSKLCREKNKPHYITYDLQDHNTGRTCSITQKNNTSFETNTWEGNIRKVRRKSGNIIRSLSLNNLCSDTAFAPVRINHTVPSSPTHSVHHSSLENVYNLSDAVSVSTRTDSESNDSSKTDKASEKSNISSFSKACGNEYIQLPLGMHCRHGSVCSVRCVANNCSGQQPSLHSAPSCLPSYPVGQDCYLKVMLPSATCLPSAIVNLQASTDYFPHCCSAVDLFGTQKGLNMSTLFPLHPSCTGTLQGCRLPCFTSGLTSSQPVVQGPSEIQLPEVLCIGDKQSLILPLENPTNSQLCYQLSMLSASLDETPIPVDMVGIDIPKTVQVNGGITKNVQVTCTAKQEGQIIAKLQVVSTVPAINQLPCSTVGSPFYVTVMFKTKRPHISFLSNGKDRIDFESVIEGSTVKKYVTLANIGTAAVPLRIFLSGENEGKHSFLFGLQEMNNHQNNIKNIEWHFLSSKVLLCRLAGCKSETEPTKLTIPIIFHAGECETGCALEKLFGTITAMLESSSITEILACITISAIVGTVKLSLKPQVEDPIILRAKEGSKTSQPLTVINKGNISVLVDLAIEGDSEWFSVSPPTINLLPMQESSLAVTFCSSTSCITAKGSLKAAAQPYGQVYNLIEMIGETIISQPLQGKYLHRDSLLPTQHSQNIIRSRSLQNINNTSSSASLVESNKKYLAWGGVNVGQIIIKHITVRNPSAVDLLNAKVYFKGKCQSFKIEGTGNQMVSILDLILNPKEEKALKVGFIPSKIGPVSGQLAIKPYGQIQHKLFFIPLCGYGGVSKVKILGLPLGEGKGYCLDISQNTPDEMAFSNITVVNEGSRAAFVKVLCVENEKCFQESRIDVQPSEFVLLENETKTLLVAYSSHSTVQQYKYHRNNSGVLVLHYGDEIMRQKMRRACKKSALKLAPSDPLKNINFDVVYIGEDKVPYDSSYPDSPKDIALFYGSMSEILVHLSIRQNDSSFSKLASFSAISVLQETSSVSDVLSNTVFSRHLTDFNPPSPPVKDTSNTILVRQEQQNLPAIKPLLSSCTEINESHLKNSAFLSNGSHDDDDDEMKEIVEKQLPEVETEKRLLWTVEPSALTLDSDNKDGRLLITNLSNRELKFKLTWSVNVICVSPVQGLLSPKSEIGLRIRIVPHCQPKLKEENQSFIKIICAGDIKVIPVKVLCGSNKQKGLKKFSKEILLTEDTGQNFSEKNVSLVNEQSFITQDSDLHSRSFCTLNFPENIKLKDVMPGMQSETEFHIKNPSDSTVRWTAVPVGLPCLQTSVITTDFPPSHSVIKLIPTEGVLHRKETQIIVAKFSPVESGNFTQLWDICMVHSDHIKHKARIQIEGIGLLKHILQASHPSNKQQPKKSIQVLNTDYQIMSSEKQRSSLSGDGDAENNQTLFATVDLVEFPYTKPGKSTTARIMLKNVSTKNCKVSVIQPLSPFFVKHTSVIVKGKFYLNLPVQFRPTTSDLFHGLLVLHTEMGYNLEIKLKGSSALT